MSGFVSILLAIVMLGILIAVHEGGHFFAARLSGIAVREFAIGMGPKILSHVSKKGIRYSLRAIPLGGFCSFYGEDDAKEKEKDDPRAFYKQKLWARMLTVLMGPVMNFVLAFMVLTGFYMYMGAGTYDPYVSVVESGAPAEEAGLLAGDIIHEINGVDVRDGTGDKLTEMIIAWDGTEPLHLLIERRSTDGPVMMETDVAPFWDEALARYRMGISLGLYLRQEYRDGTWHTVSTPITFTRAVSASWEKCAEAGSLIINALGKLVTTGEGLNETSGPVGVVSIVSQQVQENGMEEFFWLLCMISINLGIMNLLPIPGLDGSRFLFMVLEAIRRKPVPPKKEAVVHLIGMLLLFALMIWFTFRDVINLFH